MRELGGDANCVTDLQTDRRTQPFIVKDVKQVYFVHQTLFQKSTEELLSTRLVL